MGDHSYTGRGSQHKAFVGALSPQTNGDSLLHYFSKYGEVRDSVVMKEPGSNLSRCFGFVSFSDASSLEQVLTERHVIDGKQIEVERAVPKEDQRPPGAHGRGGVEAPSGPTNKLFVGGITAGVSDADIHAAFLRFGPIVEAYQMLDKTTQASRGFAFVTFENDAYADLAMAEHKAHGIILNGKKLEVQKAMPKLKKENPAFEEQFRARRSQNPHEPPPPPMTRAEREAAGLTRPRDREDDYHRPYRHDRDRDRERDYDRDGRGRGRRDDYRDYDYDDYYRRGPPPPAPPLSAAVPAGMVMVPAEVLARLGIYGDPATQQAQALSAASALYAGTGYNPYGAASGVAPAAVTPAAPASATTAHNPYAGYAGYPPAQQPGAYAPQPAVATAGYPPAHPAAPAAGAYASAAAAAQQWYAYAGQQQPAPGAPQAAGGYGGIYGQQGYSYGGQGQQLQASGAPPPPPPQQGQQRRADRHHPYRK